MNPINLSISQLWQAAVQQFKLSGASFEVQDQTLYSLVTLPAAINAPGGIQFFGDTMSTVGLQRTNLTRPNEIPGRTNYEIHGVGIRFLAPLTVLYTSFNTAIRDAYLLLTINQSVRRTYHFTEFIQTSIIAPSFSAAAGDNPVLTQQGIDYWLPLALPVPLLGGISFQFQLFFITDVAALGNTVLGAYFAGLIDRGNVKLDQTPVRPSGVEIAPYAAM